LRSIRVLLPMISGILPPTSNKLSVD